MEDLCRAVIHSPGYGSRGWGNQAGSTNNYKETATYDVRGNIMSINRNGFTGLSLISTTYNTAPVTLLGGNYLPIDNLAYTYGDSNRLMKVTDIAPMPAAALRGFRYSNTGLARDFDYDKNGNLVADANKGILKIEYNYLNLPQVITFAGNRFIKFVYDASGAKLQKITTENGVSTTYDYVNGVEYKNTILQRIAHTEGSVSVQTDGSFQHEYVLRDHLGNTRVTFSDANNDGLVTVAATELKQINSYYPFGLNMDGNFNGAAGKNKYAYNGKEWNDDFGLGMNDYGARFYDPAVARWWNIDPATDFSPNLTPYRYCFNNPINYTDPTGAFETKDEAKKYAKEYGIKTGVFRQNKIVEQKDGSFAIENRKANTSTSNDKQFGTTTAALVVERGIHLADIGFQGAMELADRNPDAVLKNDAIDRIYYFGTYLNFALPSAKLPTVAKNLQGLDFKDLQSLVKTSSNEMNAFFKSGGEVIPPKAVLEAYKELTVRILNGARGAPASKATPKAIEVQSQRLELINKTLETLK